jgi:hypothetical protein
MHYCIPFFSLRTMTKGLAAAFVDLCVSLQSIGIGHVAIPVSADVLPDQAHFGPFAVPTFRVVFHVPRSIFQLNVHDVDKHPVTKWTNNEIATVSSVIRHIMQLSSASDRHAQFENAQATMHHQGAKLLQAALKKMMAATLSSSVDSILDEHHLGFSDLVRCFTSVSPQHACVITAHNVTDPNRREHTVVDLRRRTCVPSFWECRTPGRRHFVKMDQARSTDMDMLDLGANPSSI